MNNRIQSIKAVLPLSGVIQNYVKLNKKGSEFWGLSPFRQENTASFSVNDKKGFYHCFSTGEHGDHLDFLMKVVGMGFKEALAHLESLAGLSGSSRDVRSNRKKLAAKYAYQQKKQDRETALRKQRLRENAHKIWSESEDIRYSYAENYLINRSIDMSLLRAVYGDKFAENLRFHEAVEYPYDSELKGHGPAMIGQVLKPDGKFAGVHRTYLDRLRAQKHPDLQKAKFSLGDPENGFIPLTSAHPVALVGEGIETVLSVLYAMATTGRKFFCIAGISLGHMTARLEFPEFVRKIIILPDNDSKSKDIGMHLNMYRKMAARFETRALQVEMWWPPAGADWNEVLSGQFSLKLSA